MFKRIIIVFLFSLFIPRFSYGAETDSFVFVISILFTWGLGLVVPILLRYVILKRPISRGVSIFVISIIYIIQFFISIALGNEGTHVALLLVAFISFGILNKNYALYTMTVQSAYEGKKVPENVLLDNGPCSYCGESVKSNATFCNQCGKKI